MISINCVPMDNLACGHYRIKNIADLLYGEYKVTISPPGSFHYFGQDYIFTQRVCGSKNMETLMNIKQQTGVKFIVDYDDDVIRQAINIALICKLCVTNQGFCYINREKFGFSYFGSSGRRRHKALLSLPFPQR